MKTYNKAKIESLRESYPKGTVVRCLSMDDPFHPISKGTLGKVLYVDDIGTIHVAWENGSSLGLVIGEDSFEKVDDLESNNVSTKTVKVLFVPCNTTALKVVELPNRLEFMQKLVDGLIEYFEPWNDRVAIVCNEEGKINGLSPNRKVYDDHGDLIDFVFGDFFIVGVNDDGENISLTDSQIQKYYSMFRNVNSFVTLRDILGVIGGAY